MRSQAGVRGFEDEKTQVDFRFDGIFLISISNLIFISVLDEIETNDKYES